MVRADQGSGRPFTRTRWWWIRHAPVRAHGGQIYGQADLACDCSDEAVLQSVARVLPKGAIWVSSHLSRARHTAEALWRSGYLNENEAAPALLAVPEFAEQHLGEWQGLDRARFAAETLARSAPRGPSRCCACKMFMTRGWLPSVTCLLTSSLRPRKTLR